MYCIKKIRWIGRSLLLGLVLALGVSGCTQEVPAELPTPTSGGWLTPYWTATPTNTPQPEAPNSGESPTATAIPLPTPTPVTYNIVKDDTLITIAHQHGVTLNDLLSANPGIDPNFLTIGMTITIPTREGSLTSLPTPTPIPIDLHAPICYTTSEGGQWCLALVENNQSFDVENISALIRLQSTTGDEILPQVALPTINLLRSGEAIPLAAYFPPQTPAKLHPQAELLTVIPVSSEGQRYLTPSTKIDNTVISQTQLQATVSGEISLTNDSLPAERVWVVAVAYDLAGNPVGFRKWENNTSLPPGGILTFDLTVFSLGPPIEKVEILCEARP